MKRSVQRWPVKKLYGERTTITFPDYQREPNLWSKEKKSLLIDSILMDVDIPKLYFNQVSSGYEVVDGQQRLWAIWGFLDGEFTYNRKGKLLKFSDLEPAEQRRITEYELQVTVMKGASDEYLRQMFLRLQLGLLLVMGEKLNAASGELKNFVFNRLAKHRFVTNLGMPKRRRAKETLCAQMAINSFSRVKNSEFARTRYDDLEQFFSMYARPKGADKKLFKDRGAFMLSVLDGLATSFGTRARQLKNRSFVLSVYLFAEQLQAEAPSQLRAFAAFALLLWEQLKREASLGIRRTNVELYEFQSLLSTAPGERYQIQHRHDRLLTYFAYYRKTGKIIGTK